MSHMCCGETGGAIRRSASLVKFKVTDTLELTASPTFALMALLTGVLGNDPADTLCSAAHASPLRGMSVMYLLMSAFHTTPWVRMVRDRLSSADHT